MEDHETQTLLEEVDAVRSELADFHNPPPPISPTEWRAGNVLPVILALVAGVVAWYAVQLTISENGPAPAPARTLPPVRTVPTAVDRLEPGTIISAEHLQQTAVTDVELHPELLMTDRVVVGRRVEKAIEPGDPIYAGYLTVLELTSNGE